MARRKPIVTRDRLCTARSMPYPNSEWSIPSIRKRRSDRPWAGWSPPSPSRSSSRSSGPIPLFARRNFAGRDLIAYNFPMEKAVHDAYARGRLPLWVSEISGGRPAASQPERGSPLPGSDAFSPFCPSRSRSSCFPSSTGLSRASASSCSRGSSGSRGPAAGSGAVHVRLFRRRDFGGVLSAHPAGDGAAPLDRLGAGAVRARFASKTRICCRRCSRSACWPVTSSRWAWRSWRAWVGSRWRPSRPPVSGSCGLWRRPRGWRRWRVCRRFWRPRCGSRRPIARSRE